MAAAVIVAVQGCASVGSQGGREVLGKVEGMYVEVAPGVLVDERIAQPNAAGPHWVNVILAAPTEDGRTSMSARVDRALIVARGDLVAVRVAPEMPVSVLGPAPDAIVTAIVDAPTAPVANRPASPLRKVSLTDRLN